MNKRKDWQEGLGIKSHKPFCHRPSGGLSCSSGGHSGTKCWASADQVTGAHCPCGEHNVPKRRAIFGRFLLVGGFAIMHDVSWRFCDALITFLWYFYHIYDTSMIFLIAQFKMYHSSILLYVRYLSLQSVKRWYFDTFFHKTFQIVWLKLPNTRRWPLAQGVLLQRTAFQYNSNQTKNVPNFKRILNTLPFRVYWVIPTVQESFS